MDDLAAWTHVALDWLDFRAASLPNMVFFQEINDFLTDEIQEYGDHLLGRVAHIVGAVALSLLTLWILIQGYRIVTGQSRAPMMALVVSSLRAVLIIGLATSAAAGAGSIYGALTDGMTDTFHAVITGHAESGMDQDIDKTLAIMQTALTVIDSVDTGGDVITDKTKDKALWFAGVGLGGPAITAAGALLLNKIAMALILGLGPLFILCLLFESTKPMFAAWLYYGLGTLCSLALLSVMVTLALDMVIAVGLAFWASGWLDGGQDSLLSMAMQQSGLGVLLSTLIISAPPMVAMFFRGSMGQFTAFVMFGQSQSRQTSTTGQGYPQAASDQTTTTPTHAFRDISTPSQQGDEIKRAPKVADGSFLERYPNALASLDGHGGSGDPLPPSSQMTMARAEMPAQPHVDADGYIQGAGFIENAVPALEKGSITGPRAIVLHRTDSSTASSTLASFGSGKGTHFLIDKDGTIYQSASLDQKTAHVGRIKSRCYQEGSCSEEEAKQIKSMINSYQKLYEYEKARSYPERYPLNEDSVGIETVARYTENGWEEPTEAQTASIERLIEILQRQYGLDNDDVYEHDKIAYKTPGEGADLYDPALDIDMPVVPIRRPPP